MSAERNGAGPRLGFVGAGWIGRTRMDAVAATGRARVAAIAEPQPDRRASAARAYPEAVIRADLDGLFGLDLDGIVVATPNALHAEQAVAALAHGLPVFVQKPLARNAAETKRVILAARAADRRLGVDLSYRYTAGLRCIRDLFSSGEAGRLYAMDLVFHNAYGPDKPWCWDPAAAGGGCLLDLGVHLVDLALWLSDRGPVTEASGRLYSRGRPWRPGRVEDHAEIRLVLDDDVHVRVSCSWERHAGRDAVIEMHFWGDDGGAALRNVNGSFHDFRAERYHGTNATVLAEPPDDWGPGAILDWIDAIQRRPGFDSDIERQLDVAAALDRIYEQCAY